MSNEAAHAPAPPAPHWSERSLRYVALLFCFALALAVGAAVDHFVIGEPQPWNPLGPYAVQRVLNIGKNVQPNEHLLVKATKCNATDKPVVIRGTSQWQSVVPAGTQVLVGKGTAVREPGCHTSTYDNPLPAVVVARAMEVCASTKVPSVWQITGTEVPVRDSGEGVARQWRTESFRISCPTGQ